MTKRVFKLFFILILLCTFINLLHADDVALKQSQIVLDKALMKQKVLATKRIDARQKRLSSLDALRIQISQAEGISDSYALEKKDYHLNFNSAADQSVRINRELKSFYAKFQAAKIEHNLSRVISFLGVAGQIKEFNSESLLEFFKQLQFEELLATKFQRIESEYVNFANEKIKGHLWLAGNLGGYVTKPDLGLIVVSGDTAIVKSSGSFSNLEKGLFEDGKVIHDLPFDVTGGEALEIANEEFTLWERIQQGGVVIYPILLVGLLGCLIILIKFVILLSVGTSGLILEKKIMEASENNSWDQLKTQLQGSKKYVQELLCTSLDKREYTKEKLEGFIEEQIYGYIPQLEKMMPTLNILGVISPLLGLLGTVTGMIATFDVIAVHGAGDPGLLSRGISEALITTQLGLVVAVPIILFHSLLSSKIEKNINEMEMVSNLLVSHLYKDVNGESNSLR
ncbi:MAG: hypothetical protein COA79_14090 [Planctomycetota bacterium]|nr:MAG: hypothetical protein COA79_14090 [Planctomycetota bacterium]